MLKNLTYIQSRIIFIKKNLSNVVGFDFVSVFAQSIANN